jgi:hypothetical protein
MHACGPPRRKYKQSHGARKAARNGREWRCKGAAKGGDGCRAEATCISDQDVCGFGHPNLHPIVTQCKGPHASTCDPSVSKVSITSHHTHARQHCYAPCVEDALLATRLHPLRRLLLPRSCGSALKCGIPSVST